MTVFEALGFVLTHGRRAAPRTGASVSTPVAVRLGVLLLAFAAALVTAPLDWWYTAPPSIVGAVALGSALAVGAISRGEIRLVLRGEAPVGTER